MSSIIFNGYFNYYFCLAGMIIFFRKTSSLTERAVKAICFPSGDQSSDVSVLKTLAPS